VGCAQSSANADQRSAAVVALACAKARARRGRCYGLHFSPCSDDCGCERSVTELPAQSTLPVFYACPLVVQVENKHQEEYPIYMKLDDERRQWEQEASKKPFPKGVVYDEENISGISCCWVYSEKLNNDRVILYLHGGGLVSGSALTHRNFAAKMTRCFGMSVLLVNYRLLPENEYPVPLEDTLLVQHAGN